MELYHVETQEAYDGLMNGLKQKGYVWLNGDEPTKHNFWGKYEDKTIVYTNLYSNVIGFVNIDLVTKALPFEKIVKYKTVDALKTINNYRNVL